MHAAIGLHSFLWPEVITKWSYDIPWEEALSEVILISRSPAAAAAATTAAVVEASAVVVTAAAVETLFLNPCQVTIIALSNNELLQL